MQAIDLKKVLIEKKNPSIHSFFKHYLHSTQKSFIIQTWKYVFNDYVSKDLFDRII